MLSCFSLVTFSNYIKKIEINTEKRASLRKIWPEMLWKTTALKFLDYGREYFGMEFIFGRPGFNCSLQHTISSFYKLFVVLDVVVLFLCVFVLWLSLISVGQLCNWNIVGHKAKGRILKRVFQEKIKLIIKLWSIEHLLSFSS